MSELEHLDLDLEVPAGVLEFLQQVGMRVEIAGGGSYLYLPFWIEIKDEDKRRAVFYDMDHLPGELKGALMQMRLIGNDENNESTGESTTDPSRG